MIRLKNKVILILAVLSVGLGTSYIVSGRIIQKTYYATVAQINASKDFKINIVEYKSGLFHSDAKLEITSLNNSENIIPKLTLQQHISHGPLVAVTTLDGFKIKIAVSAVDTILSEELQQQLVKFTHNPQPLTLTTVINFSNQATSWFKLSEQKQTAENPHGVFWDAIAGEIKHDLNFANYNGSIVLPRISFNSSQSTLSIIELILYFDTGTHAQNYYNNNALQTKNIILTKNDVEQLKLHDLTVKFDINRNASKQLALTLSADLAESQILDQKFGHDVAKLQITNINVANIPTTGIIRSLSLKSIIDIAQQVTSSKETTLSLELPKQFTNSLLSFASFELYRGSFLGRFDKRADDAIRKDINHSIDGLISSVLKQKLFIDQGATYALNFDGVSSQQS